MARELKDVDEAWPVTHREDLYRTDWVMALRLDELHPPGDDPQTFPRLVLEHPGAVIVLAVDDVRRAFCLWQYRHPAQRRFVELPAGLLDAEGEAPEETARRELREEAGLEAGEWTHLGTTSSGHTRRPTWRATGCPSATCARPCSPATSAMVRWSRRCCSPRREDCCDDT
jgi:hypothetical protein